MEKTARKPSADPAQERLRQNKANWNKDVSALVNDLIHFKKMMNGWPSKFFKERTRITEPIPADPATIIGSLAGDFQELANRGNGIIQEQLNYSKTRRRKQPKPVGPTPGPTPATPEAPAPEAPKPPDLAQQLGKGLAASIETAELFTLASALEDKYLLEAHASNPITRFITRLFNPKFGFGEAARMRRLRMTMLDNCVKAFKTLKVLQAEVVKSSKQSVVSSYKMMTLVWNYWNIVNRIFGTYKALRPGEVKDPGGQIEDPELAKERKLERGEDVEDEVKPAKLNVQLWKEMANKNLAMLSDYIEYAIPLGKHVKGADFYAFNSIIERITAVPKDDQLKVISQFNIDREYNAAVATANQELGTSGQTFKQIAEQYKVKYPAKTAQEFRGMLGKARHQLLPGATSGSRLEIYNLISKIKDDLDEVMNLLEAGFEQDKLSLSISQVNREMSMLRTLMRSLYYSEKPEEAPSTFF